jgi:hypothetical protein
MLVCFAIVGAAVVFGVVVARGLPTAPQQTARRSLIPRRIGVVSIVVFWTGLPVMLTVRPQRGYSKALFRLRRASTLQDLIPSGCIRLGWHHQRQ